MLSTDHASARSTSLAAYAFLFVAACCWSANTVFAKLAVGEVSPMMVVTLRWGGVVVLAWALAWRDIRAAWPALKPHAGMIAAMGALGFTGFNALFYAAAHSTTALNMGIIQGTVPVFVLAGALIALRTAIPLVQGLGALITVSGVLVVATGGQPERLGSLSFNAGDLMIIAACVLYAGYTLGLRNRPEVSALVWFAMLAVAAFVASLPLLWFEWMAGETVAPSSRGWLIVGLITVFPSFLAQIAFIRGVALIGPARSGVFVNLVPVMGSAAAVAVLGEHFQWYHGAALALVLGGIWLAERVTLK